MNEIAKPWVDRIGDAWRETVEGIIKVGKLLIDARADLKEQRGAFTAMLESGKLPFDRRNAYKFIDIATDGRIVAHAPQMPATWMTLHEITKLDDATFARKLEDGTIRPDMERKDLKEKREGSSGGGGNTQKSKPQSNAPQPSSINEPSSTKEAEEPTVSELDKAYAAAMEKLKKGEEPSRKEIMEELNLGETPAREGIQRARAYHQGVQDAFHKALNPEGLSATAQAKIEAFKKAYKKKCDDELQDRAQELALKLCDEMSLPSIRKSVNELLMILNRREPPMSRRAFLNILSLFHPDSRLSASDKKLEEAFNTFKSLEILLVGREFELPTHISSMPDSVQEWMDRKRKAQEEKRRSTVQ